METNILNIKSADGQNLPVYEFIPLKPIISSIVIIYEIFGATKHIKTLSKNLAELGYLVHVPDIFSRLEKDVCLTYDSKGFEKGIELKEKLGWEIPIMDIVSCASILKKKYAVSVMGFCYGGSLAWIAAQKSYIFDKAICYYGSSIPEYLKKNINCPALVHFGKNDKGIPSIEVKKVKQYSETQNITVKVFEYENADHGFNCDERKSYNKEAATLAMERNFKFLEEL